MRRGARGFTLVELMIVVAIIGVLAALAIYGVSRYMRNAKTAEARGMLGAMGKGNVAYYNAEFWVTPDVLAPGAKAGGQNIVCDVAANKVPAVIPKAQKYQSSEADWNADKLVQGKGFFCLKFAVAQPQNFSYDYKATNPTATNASFSAFAYGDLNGDGNTSTFEYRGAVQSNAVTFAPSIQETAPEE